MNQKIEKFVGLVRNEGPIPAVRETYKWFLKSKGLLLPDSIHNVERGVSSRRIHPLSMTVAGFIPLPPLELMVSVGSLTAEGFLTIGDVWSQLVKRHLPAEGKASVLDIGVGCGRVARFLVGDPRVARYTGFDVIEENIQWCRNHIAPAAACQTEFRLVDIYSREYNPQGTVKADEVRFPGQDYDIAYASSLFTHLLEKDARHYLRETSRTLKPSGRAIFSAHCAPAQGQSVSGTESRIDFAESYFVTMAREAGLLLRETHKGFYGQDVFIFTKT